MTIEIFEDSQLVHEMSVVQLGEALQKEVRFRIRDSMSENALLLYLHDLYEQQKSLATHYETFILCKDLLRRRFAYSVTLIAGEFPSDGFSILLDRMKDE